jgi:hypothetical protein
MLGTGFRLYALANLTRNSANRLFDAALCDNCIKCVPGTSSPHRSVLPTKETRFIAASTSF